MTLIPAPKSPGVKTTLPSEMRICEFSGSSVPGWLWRCSVLYVKCAPRRVASFSCCSKSPKPPIPRSVLSRRGHPDQRARPGVERVVHLGRVDAQLAQVVAEHHLVGDAVAQGSVHPDAAGVRRAEILVGDEPVVDTQPLRKLALGAAHARKPVDPGAESQSAAEHVSQVAGQHHLRAQPLVGVGGPDVRHVDELRVDEPPVEPQDRLVELDVVADVDGSCVAEAVGVSPVEGLLIEVADVGKRPEVDGAGLVIVDDDTRCRAGVWKRAVRFLRPGPPMWMRARSP